MRKGEKVDLGLLAKVMISRFSERSYLSKEMKASSVLWRVDSPYRGTSQIIAILPLQEAHTDASSMSLGVAMGPELILDVAYFLPLSLSHKP